MIALASHNQDIQRLLDRGYALRIDGARLVVRDIPYLDETSALKIGAFVANLKFIDQYRVEQDDHQVYFAGSVPHGLDGRPIPNLAGGPTTILLNKTDIVVQRSFSNKPTGGFPDFFAKIEHYTNVVAGPAMVRHDVSPYTGRVDTEVVGESVFKFHDTMTSRAEIDDLAQKLKNDVVAIIGLGGTGSYLLDFFVKTPVKEIRGFDGDAYHVHNAYRSPGELTESDFGRSKAAILQRRYGNFRRGLNIECKYIDESCAADLQGVTFAFVCVDKGSFRKVIFDLLADLEIPFIDVGLGLNRKQGALAGTIRMTYYSAEGGSAMRDKQLSEFVDDPENMYRNNVQIAELNALNAAFAIIRYKQIRGYYLDDGAPNHLLMRLQAIRTFVE
ncbi:MAG: ThiF family adenylyltransferase [Alphaproteobacteria bacterium]